MNTTSNTCPQLNYSCWRRPRNHWSATGPRNEHTAFRTKTHEHTQWKLERLAACATPVRPMDCAGQTGDTGQTSGQSRSGRWLQQLHNKHSRSLSGFSRPWNKNTPKTQPARKKNPSQSPAKTTPNRPRTDQQQHNPKTQEPSSSPETNPTRGSHQSDRSRASARPVVPGQLGMNRARGLTPPNPTLGLPISSTDSHKTCGIVETPHGHSIAKLWSTKTH
jgi:hypothetical protein